MDDYCRPPRRIEDGAVHVWQAQVPRESCAAMSLSHLLSPDEDLRAQRFRLARDRESYVFFRGVLRLLLSSYVGLPPNEIRLIYGSLGKPALAPECGRLEFNVSHSEGLGVFVFSNNREVGVDIEFVSESMVDWQVAYQHFSPREISSLERIPTELFPIAFFSCWTRKEAYIKARGLGLSLALDQFDVSLTPGEPPALIGSREDALEIARWSFKDLNLQTGFKGALAVRGGDFKFEFFRWGNNCHLTPLVNGLRSLDYDDPRG